MSGTSCPIRMQVCDNRPPLVCALKILGEIPIRPHNLLATISMKKTYTISFGFKTFSKAPSSILTFTTDDSRSRAFRKPGMRNPGFYLYDKKPTLEIYGKKRANGRIVNQFAPISKTNEWMFFVMRNEYSKFKKNFVLTFEINGEVVGEILNEDAGDFENMKVYAGLGWPNFKAANGVIRDLLVC